MFSTPARLKSPEKGFKVDFGMGKDSGMAVYRSKKDAEEFAKRQNKLGNKTKITPGKYDQFDNPREEVKEEKVFVVRFEKEGMRFAVPFRDMKMAKDGEKILKKSSGVSNLSVTQDVLKPGMKLSKEQVGKISKEEVEIKEMDLLITTKDDRTSDEVSKFLKSLSGGSGSKNTNKFGWPQPNKYDIEGVEVTKPKKINVMFDSSANVMPFKVKKELEKKFRNNIKVVMEEVKEQKRQLKDPKKEAMVMKVKDSGSIMVIDKKDLEKYLSKGYIQVEDNIQEARLPSFKDLVKYKYGDDHAGAIHFSKIGGKEYHWNYVGRKGGKYFVDNKPTPEIRVSRAGADSKINKIVKEEIEIQESGHTDVASMKTQVQIATDALQKMNTELGKLSDEEDLPTWWTNKVATAVSKLDGMADYIDAKQDMGKTMTEEYKSLNESAIGCLQTAMIDNNKSLKKESKMGELFLDMQMDAQEMDEREFIKVYTKKGFQAAELKSLYKEFSEEVVKEVVDNSLMSQATRVISQTAIQEKIDPADVDNVATSGDRKAADKNIVFQLRRAQDMIKQTGRQDQTGVTFKDNPKKKEKIDIRVINKVLDMFDSLRPNDKAKMQTTIGKSYRDLLKTVQRGR